MLPITYCPLFFASFLCYVCVVKVSRDYRCDKLDFKKQNANHRKISKESAEELMETLANV
jgi:hypothetical protein